MWVHAAAALFVTVASMSGSPANGVTLVDVRENLCGTASFCSADPAPDAGDQATAEQRILDGYVKKQITCTPDLPPNPSPSPGIPRVSRRTPGVPVLSALRIHNWAVSIAPTT